MSMTETLLRSQIEEQMQQACDSINAKQFDAAKAAFMECANLTEIYKLDQEAPLKPETKQITLDV